MMLGFERLMKPDVAEELGLGEVMDKYCTIMLPEGKTQEEVLVDMILGFRAADVAQPPQPETSSLHAEHSGEPGNRPILSGLSGYSCHDRGAGRCLDGRSASSPGSNRRCAR